MIYIVVRNPLVRYLCNKLAARDDDVKYVDSCTTRSLEQVAIDKYEVDSRGIPIVHGSDLVIRERGLW